jgi:hypothetical protein
MKCQVWLSGSGLQRPVIDYYFETSKMKLHVNHMIDSERKFMKNIQFV